MNYFLGASLILLGVLFPWQARAGEWSGYLQAEGRFFLPAPAHENQQRHNLSLAIQPEFYHQWQDGSSFTFVPFARLDSADPERSRFDIREMNYLRLAETWELRVGIGKVFWGVTEFVHLVDIINQTDLIESIDEEEKLGQPMVKLSIPRDWGVVDLFLLPYFRERTFPGENGRLRSSLPVMTDQVEYQSSEKQRHLDFAVRYSHSFGDVDLGLYHFNGTGREPTLKTKIADGQPVLYPYYELIQQTGLDIQWVAGEWLWKLEALNRNGQDDDFYAAVGGFEYTWVRFLDTEMDLGFIGEYAYDARGRQAPTLFNNDLMLGLRLVLNDLAGTELLAGVIQDLQRSTRLVSLEASRRFGTHWKLSAEGRGFLAVAQDDPVYDLRDDDYFCVNLSYYF